MATALAGVNHLLGSGRFKEVLGVIKGLRNGAVYGAKIRAPHAFVMTFLFKDGSLLEKFRDITQMTYQHSRNLASFVFIYKALTAIMKWLENSKKQYHSFIAAFIGGYLIFGENNKVNMQINLYLLSRIIFGFVKMGVKKKVIAEPKRDPFPWFGAIIWAIILWQFEYHRQSLQPSLRSSMTYIYEDSNVWHNLRDFLLYNK
ncbi:peroxisomal membrane protein 4-like [Saccoglossus kowalevskii]|uniref:Peroxisomal membrane protein 4-like n=1 Tax=Saccoglossus kowalevskii TaxID=10224 RepID=A0ABM0GSL2_SACKO|nr:PREDICTED: peroxisomal membrane protein 4-like [Saccoglossus kowalevskii]